MEQKGLLVLLMIVTGVVVQGQLTFRAPRISQFFDRVSNATYGK